MARVKKVVTSIPCNSKYNGLLAKSIADLYAGGQTIHEITKLPGMPSRWAIYCWRLQYPDFKELFEAAQECQTDEMIESVLSKIKKCDDPRQAKLLDVLFKSTSWYVSKVNKNKYGDQLNITHNVKVDISNILSEAKARLLQVSIPPLIEAKT